MCVDEEFALEPVGESGAGGHFAVGDVQVRHHLIERGAGVVVLEPRHKQLHELGLLVQLVEGAAAGLRAGVGRVLAVLGDDRLGC